MVKNKNKYITDYKISTSPTSKNTCHGTKQEELSCPGYLNVRRRKAIQYIRTFITITHIRFGNSPFAIYRTDMFSLNSIYFQISIYTWQHTSIQIHGKWIRKQVT